MRALANPVGSYLAVARRFSSIRPRHSPFPAGRIRRGKGKGPTQRVSIQPNSVPFFVESFLQPRPEGVNMADEVSAYGRLSTVR